MGKREIRNILDMRRNSIVSVIFIPLLHKVLVFQDR